MKYRKPKNMSYKKLNRKPIPKAVIIIGIIVAVLAIAAIITAIVVSAVNSANADKQAQYNAEIKEIQISRTPDKVNYFCGTAFDPTGLTVYSLTNGGDFTKVKLDDCTITGFDSSVPVEKQTITVTYKGFTATFNVSIKEQIPVAPQLESIAIGTMPKTEYKLGDPLRSKDGTFVCTYTDGTTKTYALSNKYVYGFVAAMESGVPGEYELTVKYTEKGVTATTTYKITISE